MGDSDKELSALRLTHWSSDYEGQIGRGTSLKPLIEATTKGRTGLGTLLKP
ncbi:MAG: hypothetical protein J6R48_07625 [Muribaculaceae bacterium]|nr:hypothetical protein [Muribaculaceae bacterium]